MAAEFFGPGQGQCGNQANSVSSGCQADADPRSLNGEFQVAELGDTHHGNCRDRTSHGFGHWAARRFSISEQRVWLVDSSETVARSYLVSGSVTDNLQPGSYSVYSRSRNAVGIDDSGTMEYFVRFTRGENAAIGFHSIPVLDGSPVQTVAQLGTPLSHGCIRQKLDDAIQLWDFAPIGTRVVVTA
ncbi:MAG: L,D-transpeptidase [Marmoricola sp.]